MTTSAFRGAAVVCSIVTATLGLGLLTPATATAATPTASSTSGTTTSSNPDFETMPVDPDMTAPYFTRDWSTPFGSRIVVGVAPDADNVWLVIGNTVYDRGTSPVFLLNVQDRHKDDLLEVISVRTLPDGSQVQSERVAMPRTIQVAGMEEENTFTPGTNHFSGTATAGATLVAKDTDTDTTLFTTKVSDTRSGVGTWSADATLEAGTDYSITFTQTTKDGKTNELRGASFVPVGSQPPEDDFDAITVDPSIEAPDVQKDWVTPGALRTLIGQTGDDELLLVSGRQVSDRHAGGTDYFFMTVQDRFEGRPLELIRIHTAADGTKTRSERIPLPQSVRVDDVKEQNAFAPGKREFTGTATAGATIVATDTKSGKTLFTTEVSGARNAAGSWSAAADLAAGTDYTITFTQTTKDGRTTELPDIAFAPEESDAPAAPSVGTPERKLDGSFVLSGEPVSAPESVVIEDEAGKELVKATLNDTGWVARVPQDRLGSTVYAVTRSESGTPSARTPVSLEQLRTDASVPKPTLRDVVVHPNGNVQVVGERDGAPALWILDGDRVVAGVAHNEAWSYVIKAQETGKQLDIANLGFAPEKGLSSLSERVALPRLLRVEGIAEDNTYTPGKRAFAGTAEAGATITATDQRGQRVFETKVGAARSGVGTWNASADLTSTAGYELTFTQTTADGRSSVMRDIAFTTEDDSVAPIVVTTPAMNGTAEGPRPTFTGTGQPGATIEIRGTSRVVTTAEVRSDGTWSAVSNIDLGRGSYALTAKQTTLDNATTETSVRFTIAAAAAAPITVTTPAMNGTAAGPRPTFTGTGQAGATIEIRGTSRVVTTAEVRSDGTWSAVSNIDLGRGSYALTAKQTTRGNASSNVPVRFTVN